MQKSNKHLEQILTAAKERRGDLNVDTMIVSSHLAQMRMFILRRGLEFFCEQDSYGKRDEFINNVLEDNMLEMKLDSIVDYFLCDGQGLFYFRPSGDTYQILYFPKDSYRCYRDQAGDIDHVELVYSFNVKGRSQMEMIPSTDGKKKKYIRLRVFKDKIEQTVSNEKIEFEDLTAFSSVGMQGTTETLTNSLGFIPAVEVFNHMDCTGESSGNGEFDWLANQIIYHDELVRNVRKNLRFFGNPTLITSRPKHDITESGDEQSFRPTISSQAGFVGMSQYSTRMSNPLGGPSPLDGQIKVPRVIANLEPTDRINYLTPDSVSGDQNLYVKQYRSEIRLALGGVDDIDIGQASTAYEIKSLYGRVAATAEKKARALFTYGLCRLISMMLQHEEYLFMTSFATANGLQKPDPPLVEDFNGDVEALAEANVAYGKAMAKFTKQRDELLTATLESGNMPPGVTGLVPDGSTRVSWRWTGEVFEEQSQDILNNSIVVRNLQELGVDSIEALKYLFPSKTDEERAGMLSGYPFRMVKETQQSLGTFISLLGNMYQLPHPQTPNLPLASDPNLDITQFLYRSLEFLRKELSYSGRYKSNSDDPSPIKLSDADRIRSERGTEPRDLRTYQLPGLTDNGFGGSTGTNPNQPNPAGFGGSSGQSLATGIPGTERKPEYEQPIPGPGTFVSVPGSTSPAGSGVGSLGFSGTTGPSPVFGSPDLQSPSYNPDILGTGSTPDRQQRSGSGKRRVSKSSKQRKS